MSRGIRIRGKHRRKGHMEKAEAQPNQVLPPECGERVKLEKDEECVKQKNILKLGNKKKLPPQFEQDRCVLSGRKSRGDGLRVEELGCMEG